VGSLFYLTNIFCHFLSTPLSSNVAHNSDSPRGRREVTNDTCQIQ